MARYTGAKTKLSRRIGRNLFLKGARSFSAKDDYSKNPKKPGEHGGKFSRRSSEYSKQLTEKQAIRYTYGLMEKQLSILFKKSFKIKGDTGKIALKLLESRLDNVIYRGGLANSRSQARQLVGHGHFTVNGIKVDIPSYKVSAGDIIEVKGNKVKKPFWESFTLEIPKESPSWLDNSKEKTIKVVTEPIDDDLPKDFNIGAVVEFYSRKVA